MIFYPDARELLNIARDTFLQRLLPLIPDSARYDALMVANALGIASRELAAEPKRRTYEAKHS
jgi:hypothetical protein